MRKRKIPVLLILGVSLIALSVALLVGMQIRAQIGAQRAQQIVADLQERLPEESAGIPGTYSNPNMPVLAMGELDYVAILEIPAWGLQMPVADQWTGKTLFDTPARFYGSAYNHSLVIGGGDYPHQFEFCDKIDLGTTVTVTDMTGARFTYTVTRVDRSKHAESQWLTDGDYDLTLFCRDRYAMTYIAVRCTFLYGE